MAKVGGKRPGAGRKPLTAEQHRKRGTKPNLKNGQSAAGVGQELEPVVLTGRPVPGDWKDPPEWLPQDAQDVWRRDVAKIIEVGVADKIDTGALEAMCLAYARAIQAGRVVASEGLFTQGSVGQLREHPGVRIERESWNAYLRMAEQFGITPIARTRLGIAELGRRTLAHDLSARLGSPTLTPEPAQNQAAGGSGQDEYVGPVIEMPDAEVVG